MKDHTSEFPVEKMSHVLRVSRSGYYKWLGRCAQEPAAEDPLDKQIKEEYKKSHRTYGSPRIMMELAKKEIVTSASTVARRMKRLNINAIRPKRYVRTTRSNDNDPVAPNLLERNFEAEQPGTKWVSDLTYFEVDHRWYYLTIILDLADRAVVGWAISDDMTTEHTTLAALAKAVINRRPAPCMIFHSDRGSQYSSTLFRDELASLGAVQSMSGRGNCWDNAVAESFFKTIKTECIYRYNFETPQQAWAVIFEYIDGWYNTRRIHTSLGGMTPREAYEVKTQINAAC
jgi:transposase InsO family protein